MLTRSKSGSKRDRAEYSLYSPYKEYDLRGRKVEAVEPKKKRQKKNIRADDFGVPEITISIQETIEIEYVDVVGLDEEIDVLTPDPPRSSSSTTSPDIDSWEYFEEHTMILPWEGFDMVGSEDTFRESFAQFDGDIARWLNTEWV